MNYDEEIIDEITDQNRPVTGVCFWVLTEFNIAHRAVKRRFKDRRNAAIEPDSFATYSEAMEIADEYAREICERFRNAEIQRLTDGEDDFHLYIVDQMSDPIAKIGVFAEDYRDKTKH